MKGCIVHLEGGVSTLLKGRSPSDLEPEISDAREQGVPFLYLHHADQDVHSADGVVNRIAVDPAKVIALIAT